ncbi:heterokaryon incompatibility protein-domain-containing protein [Xylaria curta]|nr:heterokaryon incompatibility protein-domain-containing protein [Xylaria curta]
MRLIHTKTQELREFFGSQIPAYAILSHTWSNPEITFKDWATRASASGHSYQKILDTCKLATSHGHEYVWVDTVCIDKSSSTEESEAINSMFMWYQGAAICYAYLSDVLSPTEEGFQHSFYKSRWFTRGWTLQELLAPHNVEFYSGDWKLLGTKASLFSDISTITGIDSKYLSKIVGDPYFTGDLQFAVRSIWYGPSVAAASVAERMSWLSRRETTRTEDMAYCMLGLFDINMPLLYGEGSRAFIRLQEEIMKVSNDHSLFCWTWDRNRNYGGALCPFPSYFMDSSHFIPSQWNTKPSPYSMTNAGLSITLPLLFCYPGDYFIGVLQVESTDGCKHFGITMSGDLSSGRLFRTAYKPIALSNNIPTQKQFTVFMSGYYGRDGFEEKTDLHWMPSYREPREHLERRRREFLPSLLSQFEWRYSTALLLTFEPYESLLGISTFPEDIFNTEQSILFLTTWGNPLTSRDDASKGALVQFQYKCGITDSFVISLFKTVELWRFESFWVPLEVASDLRAGNVTEAVKQFRRAIRDPEYASTLKPANDSHTSLNISDEPIISSHLGVVVHMHVHFTPKPSPNSTKTLRWRSRLSRRSLKRYGL